MLQVGAVYACDLVTSQYLATQKIAYPVMNHSVCK